MLAGDLLGLPTVHPQAFGLESLRRVGQSSVKFCAYVEPFELGNIDSSHLLGPAALDGRFRSGQEVASRIYSLRGMRRVLFVDDDAVVTRCYRDRLSAHGFQVNTAADGNAAITILRGARPDIVVLDLMMPNVSGVDVLRFIRSEPRLVDLPVVVLTNAYLNDLGTQAAALGFERALLKGQCNPSALMAAIDEITAEKRAAGKPPPAEEVPVPAPSAERAVAIPLHQPSPAPAAPPTRPIAATPPTAPGSTPTPAGVPLDVNPITACAELRKTLHAMTRAAAGGPDRARLLQELYRQVHFLSAAAGVNGYAQLVQTAAVFEALLYELRERPSLLSPSVLRTLANLVDFVEVVLQRAGQPAPNLEGSASVLVVDDDPLSNRVVVSALRQAQLEASSTEDPLTAWDWLQHTQFALVLLDIEMPGLNGFDLCKRLRGLPGYAKTPVIYFTVHSDFENRVKSTLSGGNDLISKPVVPLELAAKVVMHLQKSRLLA